MSTEGKSTTASAGPAFSEGLGLSKPRRDIVDILRDKSGAWINGLYDDEAANEIERLRVQVRQADERGDEAMRQKHYLHDLVRWAYGKVHHASYSKQDDALMLDRIKLWLEHGVEA